MKPSLIIGLVFLVLIAGMLFFLSSLAERSAPAPTEITVPVSVGGTHG